MPLPPDRGAIATEARHPASGAFDALSTDAAVRLLIDDHRRVPDALAMAQGALATFIDGLVERMRYGGRLIYAGAGTSGRLGVLDAAECPPTFYSDPATVVAIIAGGDAAIRRSSEAREDDPTGAEEEIARLDVGPLDTFLGIAAGGSTPWVLGAIALAKARGAATALLTCARPAAGIAACDHVIALDTGPEILTGSTRLKAGSATKLALNIVSTVAFTQLGSVYGNLMVDVRASNDKLLDRAIRILREISPSLSRDAARELLDRTGGRLKVAIVMDRLGLDAGEAQARLDAHGGRLREVLGEP